MSLTAEVPATAAEVPATAAEVPATAAEVKPDAEPEVKSESIVDQVAGDSAVSALEIASVAVDPETRAFNMKSAELDKFLYQYKDLPEQRSAAWKAQRIVSKIGEFTVGGSETEDLVRRRFKTLIMKKMGWSVFAGNVATRWGQVLEAVGQRRLEVLFKTTIHETGSLPGSIPNTSYSPDGFAVIRESVVANLIKTGVVPAHKFPPGAGVALFEIKTPYSRIPTNAVPKNYILQPTAGLAHFPILDIAYFADSKIERMALPDLVEIAKTNTADIGIVCFYCPAPINIPAEPEVGDDSEGYKRGEFKFSGLKKAYESGEPIDIGKISDVVFGLAYWEASSVLPYHIFNSASLDDFTEFCEQTGSVPVAYMGYQITKFVVIPMYRDPTFNFAEIVGRPLAELREFIEEIQSATDPRARFEALFP